jgi:hypothetical protein
MRRHMRGAGCCAGSRRDRVRDLHAGGRDEQRTPNLQPGIVHIRGVVVDTSLSIDPRTCIYSGRVQHTGTVVGGTKLFAAATGNYTATVRGWGRARRASDGTCTVDEAALYEIDTFVISGSMTL